MLCDVRTHYDLLIEEGNDPVLDPPPLRDYMAQWDGDAFFSLFPKTNLRSVLEIGVGTGRLAQHIAPRCAHFIGIDLSPKTIHRAQEHLSAHPNVTLLCGDFMNYPFETTFDVIYSSLTFMHLPDKQRAIDKIAALLPTHGLFLLSIDKNTADFIDMGTRRIPIYPDDPDAIKKCLARARMTLQTHTQTPRAHLISAIRA